MNKTQEDGFKAEVKQVTGDEKVDLVLDKFIKVVEEIPNNSTTVDELNDIIEATLKDNMKVRRHYSYMNALCKLAIIVPSKNYYSLFVKLIKDIKKANELMEFENSNLKKLQKSTQLMKKNKNYQDVSLVFALLFGIKDINEIRVGLIDQSITAFNCKMKNISYTPGTTIDNVYEEIKPIIEEGIAKLKK